MLKPVTIIKVMHTDGIGFHLIPVLHAGRVVVFAATKTSNPSVVVEGFGDFRSEVIPVAGDVTIMNPDGLVLSEVSYEKLMAPVRIEELTEETLQPIREALSGDRPIDWEELNKLNEIPSVFPTGEPGTLRPEDRLETKEEVEERRRRYSGWSIQGAEPTDLWNGAVDLRIATPTIYSYDTGRSQFIPSDGYDQMDKLISRDHVPAFAQMFQWMVDLPPNGTWTLYVNTAKGHFDNAAGIMECSGTPHIVVIAIGAVAVDTLKATEKEFYGLSYTENDGWKVSSLANKQAFRVRLINNYVWDIQPINAD